VLGAEEAEEGSASEAAESSGDDGASQSAPGSMRARQLARGSCASSSSGSAGEVPLGSEQSIASEGSALVDGSDTDTEGSLADFIVRD